MDIKKFICLVQEQPVLCCTHHPDYMRTKLKDELRDKIGVELISEGITAKEQWWKGFEIIVRWSMKGFREYHQDALRRQRKKIGRKAPPWYSKWYIIKSRGYTNNKQNFCCRS